MELRPDLISELKSDLFCNEPSFLHLNAALSNGGVIITSRVKCLSFAQIQVSLCLHPSVQCWAIFMEVFCEVVGEQE